MAWEIYFNTRNSQVDIRSWGDVTTNEMVHSLSELELYCRERKVKSVLIDTLEVRSLPTKTSLISFIEHISGSGIPNSVQFALLTCKEHWSDVKLFEKYGADRGMHIGVFFDRQKAWLWLKERDNMFV